VILAGDKFNITGQNFTAGSEVNLFVATSAGAINGPPLIPIARSLPAQFTVTVPASVPLGNGFVAVQVVNTDQLFIISNTVPALLQGAPAASIPTITSINGHGLATTSSDSRYATNNVETVVVPGKVVTLGGRGFLTGLATFTGVGLFCACPGGKVGPFSVRPTSGTSISFTLPATGPNAPVTGPGSFVVTNSSLGGFTATSNAVSVPIGALVSVQSVVQSVVPATLITVNGTGFSTLTVINFFNTKGGGVVNLGGLKSDGTPVIPLHFVSDTQFTFTVPAAAVAGESYVEALNPPFVPFSTSDNDPGGAFTLK